MLRFDVCMSLSSLWILVAAWIVRKREPAYVVDLMILQTIVSMLYWMDRSKSLLRHGDRLISSMVFLHFTYRLFFSVNKTSYLMLPLLSAFFFIISCCMKCRERWLRSREEAPLFLYLFPHASFRFFAFWMVIFASSDFNFSVGESIALSVLYYSSFLTV